MTYKITINEAVATSVNAESALCACARVMEECIPEDDRDVFLGSSNARKAFLTTRSYRIEAELAPVEVQTC